MYVRQHRYFLEPLFRGAFSVTILNRLWLVCPSLLQEIEEVDTAWYRKAPPFTTFEDGNIAFSLDGAIISVDGTIFTPTPEGPSFTIDPPFPPNSSFWDLPEGSSREFMATSNDSGQLFSVRVEVRDGQRLCNAQEVIQTELFQSDTQRAYQPSQEDIAEYARFLGIQVRSQHPQHKHACLAPFAGRKAASYSDKRIR